MGFKRKSTGNQDKEHTDNMSSSVTRKSQRISNRQNNKKTQSGLFVFCFNNILIHLT